MEKETMLVPEVEEQTFSSVVKEKMHSTKIQMKET
jgi:hypothetical protein